MKHFTITFLLTFRIASHLFAQQLTQTVKGRVVDQQSKSPVIGASVLIANSNPVLGSTTDMDGYFKIANVAIGRQNIMVTSIGYEPGGASNINLTSGKEVFLEVAASRIAY